MNCPICSSNNILNQNKIKNIWNKSDCVLFCSYCKLYFLEKIPKRTKIDKYYKEEYHHYSKIKFFLKNIFRKFRSVNQFNYIKNNLNDLSHKKILEIGACDGLLLSYFKSSIVKGIDYSPIYKEIALKKYGINLTDENFLNINEKFDLIIMSHVIEHLPDINIVVKKLKDLLNTNGYLFVEVPNSPKPKDRDKEYINKYLSTPHLYNFTEKSLKKVFIKHDLNVVSFNRFYYNFSGSYTFDFQEEIAEVFLRGSGLKYQNIFLITIYLIKNIINPVNSYKKITINQHYRGLGDNLRIILQK